MEDPDWPYKDFAGNELIELKREYERGIRQAERDQRAYVNQFRIPGRGGIPDSVWSDEDYRDLQDKINRCYGTIREIESEFEFRRRVRSAKQDKTRVPRREDRRIAREAREAEERRQQQEAAEQAERDRQAAIKAAERAQLKWDDSLRDKAIPAFKNWFKATFLKNDFKTIPEFKIVGKIGDDEVRFDWKIDDRRCWCWYDFKNEEIYSAHMSIEKDTPGGDEEYPSRFSINNPGDFARGLKAEKHFLVQKAAEAKAEQEREAEAQRQREAQAKLAERKRLEQEAEAQRQREEQARFAEAERLKAERAAEAARQAEVDRIAAEAAVLAKRLTDFRAAAKLAARKWVKAMGFKEDFSLALHKPKLADGNTRIYMAQMDCEAPDGYEYFFEYYEDGTFSAAIKKDDAFYNVTTRQQFDKFHNSEKTRKAEIARKAEQARLKIEQQNFEWSHKEFVRTFRLKALSEVEGIIRDWRHDTGSGYFNPTIERVSIETVTVNREKLQFEGKAQVYATWYIRHFYNTRTYFMLSYGSHYSGGFQIAATIDTPQGKQTVEVNTRQNFRLAIEHHYVRPRLSSDWVFTASNHDIAKRQVISHVKRWVYQMETHGGRPLSVLLSDQICTELSTNRSIILGATATWISEGIHYTGTWWTNGLFDVTTYVGSPDPNNAHYPANTYHEVLFAGYGRDRVNRS